MTPTPNQAAIGAEHRSLYEISGCIADVNTMLIGRDELRALLALLAQFEEQRAVSARMEATADEDAHVITRLSSLLAGVAIALKGDELPLHRHSYHDLADVAGATKLELDLYRAAFPDGIPGKLLDAAIDAAAKANGSEKS